MVPLTGTHWTASATLAKRTHSQVWTGWRRSQLEGIPWSWFYAWDCFGRLWSKTVEYTPSFEGCLGSSSHFSIRRRNPAIVDRLLTFFVAPLFNSSFVQPYFYFIFPILSRFRLSQNCILSVFSTARRVHIYCTITHPFRSPSIDWIIPFPSLSLFN